MHHEANLPKTNNLSVAFSLNLFILARLHRKPNAYLKRSRIRSLGLEPVLVVFGGDLKNAPTVVIELVNSRSLGRHHFHNATATLNHPIESGVAVGAGWS